MENNTWDFMRAPRFWVMLAGTISVYLQMKGWIGEAETILIASTSALFLLTKTIDRAVDHTANAKVYAAEVSTDKETIWFDTEK